jgi:hypothetical protein
MKAKLGQFFTTNSNYILQGLTLDRKDHKFIEPFCGNGDLLKHYSIENAECYDIQPRNASIQQRDTLRNPPSFREKFLITNPPYLAKNKSTEKDIYEKYDEDDLYKCFLRIIIKEPCLGGILILPINFLACPKIVSCFVDVYQITAMNVFEEQVFSDTTSSVCSFVFRLRESRSMSFPITFYPTKDVVSFLPDIGNNFVLGGEVYNLKGTGKYKVRNGSSKLVVKCIDDTATSLISMSFQQEPFVGKTSDRAYVSILIEPPITDEQQVVLAKRFNDTLAMFRNKHHSMFLTSFREGTRKRITFTFVYQFVEYLLDCDE